VDQARLGDVEADADADADTRVDDRAGHVPLVRTDCDGESFLIIKDDWNCERLGAESEGDKIG
jgi:hypothetical protein